MNLLSFINISGPIQLSKTMSMVLFYFLLKIPECDYIYSNIDLQFVYGLENV